MLVKDSNIACADYFDDLKITAGYHRGFPNGSIHRVNECEKGLFSLEMILDGSVKLHLDEETILLEGPCVFWIGDRNSVFQYELIPDVSYDHLWIDFTGERGRRIYESLSRAYPMSFIKLGASSNTKGLQEIFDYFALKFSVARPPSSIIKDVLLVEQLVGEVLMEAKRLQSANDPYGLQMLSENIQNSPFEKYDLKRLAAGAGLSYFYFRKLFKERFGEPPRKYILRQQMQTAGELLKSGQFWIGELSDYCGFPDISSFSRTFKRFYKMSPREWLVQNGKNYR